MEPSNLSDQLRNVTSEVYSMKKVMVDRLAFENQFLKIEQQLAEIVDEMMTIKSTLKNEKDIPTQTLNSSSAKRGNTIISHCCLALDEQVKGQWLTIGIVKENVLKLQNEISEQSKILHSVTEQQKCTEGKINFLFAKMEKDSQKQHEINNQLTHNFRDWLKALKHKEKIKKTNKTFCRLRNLECKVAVYLKNSRSFVDDIVEERMQSLTESVEDNTYDIQQCWKMIEEMQEEEQFFMLNGEKVKLEDEINRLIFGQETLLAQSEEQMNSTAKIQDDISGKYDMMKVLVLKQIGGMEKLKNFLAILNIMTKSRQELGKQVDLLKQDVAHLKLKESSRHQVLPMTWKTVDKFRKFPVGNFNAKGTPVSLDAPKSEEDIKTRLQCIAAMKIYENKSLEELRLLDYSDMDAKIKSEYDSKMLCSLSPIASFGNENIPFVPSLSTSHFKNLPDTKLQSCGSNTTTATTTTYSEFGNRGSTMISWFNGARSQFSQSELSKIRRPARRRSKNKKTTTAATRSVKSCLFTTGNLSLTSSSQFGSTTIVSGLFGPTTTSSAMSISPSCTSVTSSSIFDTSTSSSSRLFDPFTTTSSGPTKTSTALLSSSP